MRVQSRRVAVWLRCVLAAALLTPLLLPTGIRATYAASASSDTPNPATVTVVGSLQSELGCGGDWDPACAATQLGFEAGDAVWQGTWTVPAGNWEYKAALNQSWDENYGANATRGGNNIGLNLSTAEPVKFYYDHETHWITSNRNAVIATLAGSLQSELGCSGDWQPDCLRSWLQDPDGDGQYAFATTALAPGNYEVKVAHNESWAENYGAGGVRDGANIAFTVPAAGVEMKFTYDPATHALAIRAGNQSYPDNNVEWDGLRHDSRDPLYRTPGGAVPAGTAVTLRLRTFHNDVTAVKARFYSLNRGGQQIVALTPAAADVSCYQAGLETRTCDFWAVTLPPDVVAEPENLWYRFIVEDGSDTDYYGDNTAALDGGLGQATDDVVDQSYALMVYDPAFTAPAWAPSAVIYQIFPDRFRNGNPANDPQTGDPRYDDPVLALPWGTLPEGYCRNYDDRDVNCPWRYDDTPPSWSPAVEGARGRDYFGGDLRGIIQRLPYLRSLGVNTLYLNPIFAAQSNHRYDTADYYQIDPALGTLADFQELVQAARANGMRLILDGVYNHLSSDSAVFDRYQRYAEVGACEAGASAFRPWFYFRPPGANEPAACAPSTAGGMDTFYDGWFGFDSIPVIRKDLAAVQEYFITADDSVTQYWIRQGTRGWRMDVMGDASFPDGYWEAVRDVVKTTDPNSIIIGELWQKDSTLLRYLRGDRADTTMNYRMRDAVIGFLTPGAFDAKGFGDSGRVIAPSEFAARLASIREDYPDAAYYALMNLLGSHDTERILWSLTPGAQTTADKELNAANLEAGKQRLRLAALIQFTLPGAPTIYYGDEIGLTGDDDPDDRRTYPWTDGSQIDEALRFHYRWLTNVRQQVGVLTSGDFRVLLADDAAGTVAYARRNRTQVALVLLNRNSSEQTLTVPLAGYLPDGTLFNGVGGANLALKNYLFKTVRGGALQITLPAMSGVLLLSSPLSDVTPPAAPAGLTVTNEGDGQVSLSWSGAAGASGYNVYRSPLSGGGFVKVNPAPVGGTIFTDTGLTNGQTVFYVVRARDGAGNEGGASNEVSALPHFVIGWANLQWPPTLTHIVSAVDRTDDVYGQVWINNVTNQPGAAPTLRAQLGFGPAGTDPAAGGWTWVDAAFNTDAGNNDEFKASLQPEAAGAFDYVYRYSTTHGRDWLYADLNGPIPAGALPPNPGKLTVQPSADTTAPTTPTGLRLVAAAPTGITLAWDAVTGDATLYGYEVLRGTAAGGPYTQIARVTAAEYTDTAVELGPTYTYVVRAVDQAFNRSGNSNEVAAVAELRTVSVTFTVTVPASTDGTGKAVTIAGTLSRFDGGHPDWDPGAVALTRVDATHWTITLTGKETTSVEYKYALGAWDFVEKGGSCEELGNRLLTLSYGANGTQAVNDTVLNWRNVSPCGN